MHEKIAKRTKNKSDKKDNECSCPVLIIRIIINIVRLTDQHASPKSDRYITGDNVGVAHLHLSTCSKINSSQRVVVVYIESDTLVTCKLMQKWPLQQEGQWPCG